MHAEAIGIFHVLLQSGVERSIPQKNQPNFFHEPEEPDMVFRGNFDFDRTRDRSIIELRLVWIVGDKRQRIGIQI
jgi:hypothetical protein